ncbi:hypothetical protein EYF80_018756 [Liparis tanakae]|uniref:Uncharacterized protein n=1 Tax=Liparis tanakae TaxID=230148 RepID=A0A4Z2HZG6_9TELE|nr:hypothetical protein EYF80_018756 [Liparis tanakae]
MSRLISTEGHAAHAEVDDAFFFRVCDVAISHPFQSYDNRPIFRSYPVPVAMEMTSCCSIGLYCAAADRWAGRERESLLRSHSSSAIQSDSQLNREDQHRNSPKNQSPVFS